MYASARTGLSKLQRRHPLSSVGTVPSCSSSDSRVGSTRTLPWLTDVCVAAALRSKTRKSRVSGQSLPAAGGRPRQRPWAAAAADGPPAAGLCGRRPPEAEGRRNAAEGCTRDVLLAEGQRPKAAGQRPQAKGRRQYDSMGRQLSPRSGGQTELGDAATRPPD